MRNAKIYVIRKKKCSIFVRFIQGEGGTIRRVHSLGVLLVGGRDSLKLSLPRRLEDGI